MRTMLIDCNYPIEDSLEVKFASTVSCYDFDVVMWDIEGTFDHYNDICRKEQGLPTLNDGQSRQFLEAIQRRRDEFKEILRLGRALVIFPGRSHEILYPTGERTYSGTGRNRVETRTVAPISFHRALPFELEISPGAGVETEALPGPLQSLWRETQGYWVYRGVLKKYPGSPAFKISQTDNTVGSYVRYKDGGILAILPEPYWDPNGDEEGDEESGPSTTAQEHSSTPEQLHAWLCSQMREETEDAPVWVAGFSFPEARALDAQLSTLQDELKELLEKIDKVKASQAEEEKWKRLLYSQGGALESEVERALQTLGFEILPTVQGRADIRVKSGDSQAVVEVKGISKSAAEKHAAQLEKWVSEEIIAGESAPAAILIVNAWREKSLTERTQPAFPDQMLSYSKSKGHCLVTSTQLLLMARTVMAEPAKAEEIRNELLSTVGIVPGWDLPSPLIIETEDAVTDEAPETNQT
ncbi:hypothetical protein ACGFZG_01085 [Streptomyces antibioticus]|uniref:hypothetical protein n=1 Tax=Streptomyces antibioticus TaxID=1890 RepID=UPI00372018ED